MLHLGQVTSCKPYFPNMHTILCTLCVASAPSYYSVQLNHLCMFSVAPTFFSFSELFLLSSIFMLSRELLSVGQPEDTMK